MKISNNEEDHELDCYLNILEYFQNVKIDKKNTDIWKNQSFIDLMKLLENKKNRALVTNAIILILSLFDDIPPDTYNSRGEDINMISIEDRKSLFAGLDEDFLPN